MSNEAGIFIVLLAAILIVFAIVAAVRKARRGARLRGSGNPYYDREDGGPLDTGLPGEDG